MHVINAMFAKGLGGIEQCFLDYCRALDMEGNKVTALLHPEGRVLSALPASLPKANVHTVTNRGQWDILAKYRLRKLLKHLKPDVIITHGNRAVSLLLPAAKGICPVVGITHNYSLDRLLKLDAVLALTDDLKQTLIRKGYPPSRIFRIPNMVDVTALPPAPQHQSPLPVIVTLGRFVEKKGFDVFLRALAVLHQRHIPFSARIGGTGEEEVRLKQLTAELGLEDQVTFTGWANDKTAFFHQADIFCLPSHHEPFGIVLLEAMAFGLPVVSTASEGPREILNDKQNGLLVPCKDPDAMADALQHYIKHPALARSYALNALETVKEQYDISVVSSQLQQALHTITQPA